MYIGHASLHEVNLNLAADVSSQAVRDVHGEDGERRKVEGGGRRYHGDKEGPVQGALAAVVVARAVATHLLHEGGLEAERKQHDGQYERQA